MKQKSKVPAVDLIAIYCTLVRSILEYGSPVSAALPEYLSDDVEGVQKKALRIVFPGLANIEALVAAGLQTLATHRGQACVKFLHDARARRDTMLGAYIYCIADKLSRLHDQVRKHEFN